ncbi:MAG: hypothetical protein RMY29_026780 [Nostoc sp. CreGUA01]|nr:hypothetical protein [Nostoc sp. CreGUA01]
MTNVAINELNVMGYDLFNDSENFFNELTSEETQLLEGGFYNIWTGGAAVYTYWNGGILFRYPFNSKFGSFASYGGYSGYDGYSGSAY